MAEIYEWQDGQHRWLVPYDRSGEGPLVVCLPAPSTISTREEMRELAERLARGRRVIRLDWPGFGDADRYPCRYESALYVRFLTAFLEDVGDPTDVVAAGHGASYALEVSRAAPRRFHRLALLAPTWRGPLPTAMGPHPRAWGAVEWLVRAPLIGSLLYTLNSSRGIIRWMMSRHVYAEPGHITEALLDARVRTAHRPNARFAAGAFVTGGLDAFASRERFLEAARAFPGPLLVAMGTRSPYKSLAEMQAIATLPNVRSMTLPGSLAFYDEYPDETGAAVASFLDAP